jgi:hypothetical protein
MLELVEDAAFRLIPARDVDFREMLGELRTWPKLRDGFRNLAPVEEESLVALRGEIAEFALAHDRIEAIDLNPVVFRADAAMVLDAAITTRD